ncbi:MAG: Asp-tRNA(Asn)/Glu-tRNA(Gln) amidotransferase subunit GatC [Propionibacteriaceae bacterium]|nr:Asp-tRNA(Asn)/Glu-tRNA(Gln) amidotransferase subunit GatC [Propionibacteriaceae bacterium]
MALTPDDIARLSDLARIDLSQEECVKLAPQLEVILDAVARVSEVAAADIPPTSHALALANVFRPDEVRASLTQHQALSGAPDAEDGRFRVPQILGEQ